VNQSSADYESASTLAAIIANCKRLIADAKLLLEHGSRGSALSLAILAFEEAGKGHREEMELVKTKRTPSWHQFRQIVAGFVLQLAVLQKYGIKLIELPEQVRAELRARQESAKLISEIFRRPISDELRSAVAEASRPAIEHLSGDQAAIAQLELRYIRMIFESAAKGEIEENRQRGMYVDIADGKIASDPAAVGMHEVYRWIFAAERALLLLETGDFMSPFSPLAARLEEKMGVRPETDENVLEFYRGIFQRVLAGEDFIDVYFSTLPKAEQGDMQDLLPMMKELFKDQCVGLAREA